MKRALYKVPNGKLLKIGLAADAEGRIEAIRIAGDFFAYPEERIEKLETYLKTTKLTESGLRQKLEIFFHQYPTELYGIDIDSLVHTILEAAKT